MSTTTSTSTSCKLCAEELPAGITTTHGKRGHTYRVRWTGRGGKDEGRTFKQRQAALDFHTIVRADALRGMATAAPSASAVRFGDYARAQFTTEGYLGNGSKWGRATRSTQARRHTSVHVHLLPMFEHTRLDAITRADVVTFIAKLEADGYKPNTVRNNVHALSAILSYARSEGLVPTVVTEGVLATAGKRRARSTFAEDDEGDLLYLDALQVRTLADAMGDEWRALVYVGAVGGLRIGEMLALRWRHVQLDLDAPYLDVRDTLARDRAGSYLDEVKTQNGKRRVPTGPLLAAELRAHRERAQAAGRYAPSAFVFPPPADAELWRDSRFRSLVWRPALARAEGTTVAAWKDKPDAERVLPRKLTPHKLRHTAVSLWIAGGHEPRTVSRRAGHASIAFTYDTYGGLWPETGDHADRVVAQLLSAVIESPEQSTALLHSGAERLHLVQ